MPRQLRCPRCGMVNTVPDGQKPACANCGFGSGAGPAAAPPPPGASGVAFKRAAPPDLMDERLPMPRSLVACIVLFGIAFLLAVLLMFPVLHWSTGTATAAASNSAAARTSQYDTWGMEGGLASGSASGSTSYWDGKMDTQQGIELMRSGGPLLAAGAAAVLVAGVAAALRKSLLCNVCGWIAVTLLATMVALFSLGIHMHEAAIQSTLGGTSADSQMSAVFSWAAGLYLGIAAALVAAAATALGPPRLV